MPSSVDLTIPDIGDAEEVEVIEISPTAGDILGVGDDFLTVESDKAAMDIPCERGGRVSNVLVAVGDKVRQGQVFATIVSNEELDSDGCRMEENQKPIVEATEPPPPVVASNASDSVKLGVAAEPPTTYHLAPAGPASRRLARELGVDINKVVGSGRRGRIFKEDVKEYAKSLLSNSVDKVLSVATNTEELPDISKFGPTHCVGLSKVEQITSRNMQRAWREIPHAWLQQHIDVTELDQGRKRLKAENPDVSFTAMVIKAVALALKQFPRFNCVLDAQAQQVIYRDYLHIGVAVDTPRGLVIAVIKDCDTLTIAAIGAELTRLSSLAREGKLHASDMQGASMTVSSLGGLGIDGLQPIVNWPEVAILGIARARMQPVYDGEQFEPRLILPATLGFDHRVINGADGARFLDYMQGLLSDPMRLLIHC